MHNTSGNFAAVLISSTLVGNYLMERRLPGLLPLLTRMFSWFQVSWDNKEVDLIPDGSSIAVNNKNKYLNADWFI